MKKYILAAAIATALSVPPALHAQAANQVLGGYTTIALNSSFVASTRESGIFLADLNGNSLPGSATSPGEVTNNLGAVSGVIDLDTGETNVSFRGGFLINYIGQTTVQVENLVLHAGKTSAGITGDVTSNGTFLGREEVFAVLQNPGLVLPLKPVAGVLTLPAFTLGLSPKFLAQVAPIIGSQFTATTPVATAKAIAIVSKEPSTPIATQ